MAEYKIKDILDPSLERGNLSVKNFINLCKKNISTDKFQKSNLYKKLQNNQDLIFCQSFKYGSVDYITIPRKTLEVLITSATYKTQFTIISIKNILISLSGNSNINQNEFFEFHKEVSSKDKQTSLKQDFTCYAIWYFFNNQNNTLWDFHDYLKIQSSSLDKKISISSELNELKEFALPENYSYFLDSVAVAKTLIKNASKFNISKGDLSSYIIAEEDSDEGIKYKSLPFKKISLTENNYYNAPDKLTTADIFLIKTGTEGNKTLSRVFNQRTLTHLQYQKFIDEAFNRGEIVPISLKKLNPSSIGPRLTTGLIKIIGSPNNTDKRLKDPFFSTVLEILSISDENKFKEKMEEVIQIDDDSFDYKLKEIGRTTFKFKVKFTDKKRASQYEAFLQAGQIYLKSQTTSSASGIGGIARDFVNDEIIKNLPEKNKFFRHLIEIRKKTFEEKINGVQQFNIKDIKVDYTDILPGLTYKKPALTKKGEITEDIEIAINAQKTIIENLTKIVKKDKNDEYAKIQLKIERENLKKIGRVPVLEEIFSEAVKLGLGNKVSIQKIINSKDGKLLKNLIDKIFSKSQIKKQTELVNAVVKLNLMDKKSATMLEINQLKEIIESSKAYVGLSNYPALNKSNLLSSGSLSKIFAKIPAGLRKTIAERYVKNLCHHLGSKYNEIFTDYMNEFHSNSDFMQVDNTRGSQVSFSEITKIFFEKISSYEMIYLCSVNKTVVKNWIKSSFIMSVYAAAAAYGIIIFNGKRHQLKGGSSSYAKITRKNPVYVKIGE